MEVIAALMGQEERPRRSYGPFWLSLLLVAGGGAAFWHDHITHEIPNPVAVEGRFVSATCHGSRKNTGPYMSIGYEFPSLSSRVRTQEMKCFVDKCESHQAPQQVMDTGYKEVFYSSQQECKAALPAVLAARPPATVWTGDKGPQAAVRARFTPQRHPPPYFLLWLPLSVAAAALVFSAVRRGRRPGEE